MFIMDEGAFFEVRRLLSKNLSPEEVKSHLLKRGFLESDVELAIEKAAIDLRVERVDEEKVMAKRFLTKELLDRIGYGFVSHPFLNILFSFTGASYFIIGLINGLRTVLSLVYSSYMKEFSKVHILNKSSISRAGIIYGFSFLIMSFAVVLGSPLLYSLAFLAGALGVVAHGELYVTFMRSHLKKERMGAFLSKISIYGVIITIVSLLISGFVMDLFPRAGKVITFTLFGTAFNFTIYGYLISFEITAFAFILSGFILSRMKQKTIPTDVKLSSFAREFWTRWKIHSKFFVRNKVVVLLVLTSIITGIVQVLGNSFYGIFIYNNFKDQFLGGFLNVAIVFAIAVLAAFVGPWITRKLQDKIGVSPMLVFGTLLTAMLPLSLVFNPHLLVVAIAAALSIVGASILGMAQGFFTKRLLSDTERQVYFSFIGLAVAIPLLVLTPIGAYFAHAYSLQLLFKILICLLVFAATPLYFVIVLLYERNLEKVF